MTDWQPGQIKAFFEAVLNEQRAATELANAEREKAASVARESLTQQIEAGDKALAKHIEEQTAAAQLASMEREKAAQILREGLLHQIMMGDQALERHIADQVAQLRQLVASQSELHEQASAAAKEAISKAEAAAEKRFESVNEFRDEARAVREQQQKQIQEVVGTLMPREVAEQRIEDLRHLIETKALASEEKTELRASTNATRITRLEGFQARLVGGLAVVALIGITNLVKLWFA